jgi:hypothetical protein
VRTLVLRLRSGKTKKPIAKIPNLDGRDAHPTIFCFLWDGRLARPKNGSQRLTQSCLKSWLQNYCPHLTGEKLCLIADRPKHNSQFPMSKLHRISGTLTASGGGITASLAFNFKFNSRIRRDSKRIILTAIPGVSSIAS